MCLLMRVARDVVYTQGLPVSDFWVFISYTGKLGLGQTAKSAQKYIVEQYDEREH